MVRPEKPSGPRSRSDAVPDDQKPNQTRRVLFVKWDNVAMLAALVAGAAILFSAEEVRAAVFSRAALLLLGAALVLGSLGAALSKYLGGGNLAQGATTLSRALGTVLSVGLGASFAAGLAREPHEKPTDPPSRARFLGLFGTDHATLPQGPMTEPPSEIVALRQQSERAKQRLQDEIHALARRANTNLIIGITTTVIAVLLLAYVALTTPPSVTDLKAILPQFAIRVALSIFIQVFAFFFLRLYRATLVEIKFFQNELTTVELRIMAFEAAMIQADPECARGALVSMLATERNFVLKAGESTVDLEKARADSGATKETLDKVAAIVKAVKG